MGNTVCSSGNPELWEMLYESKAELNDKGLPGLSSPGETRPSVEETNASLALKHLLRELMPLRVRGVDISCY